MFAEWGHCDLEISVVESFLEIFNLVQITLFNCNQWVVYLRFPHTLKLTDQDEIINFKLIITFFNLLSEKLTRFNTLSNNFGWHLSYVRVLQCCLTLIVKTFICTNINFCLNWRYFITWDGKLNMFWMLKFVMWCWTFYAVSLLLKMHQELLSRLMQRCTSLLHRKDVSKYEDALKWSGLTWIQEEHQLIWLMKRRTHVGDGRSPEVHNRLITN